jgi:sugar phosphate isomerase/epimerase
MTMNAESVERAIENSCEYLAHVHVSEPNLRAVGAGGTDHHRVAAVLRSVGYSNWVSIEMRGTDGPENVMRVERALDFVANTYN